jgi:hypothetical protein
VNEVVLDLDDAGLDAEFLAPHPIRKHADARPKRREAQIVELHL